MAERLMKAPARCMNDAAETASRSYATMETAQKAVEKYGAHDGSIAYLPRKDGRIVVFIINAPHPGTALHFTPFVIWS